MSFLKTTARHTKYWRERKIDWNLAYLKTWNHPHRAVISSVLATFPWTCLYEVGCGPGPNLLNILTRFKGVQLGGTDVNADAIAVARETFVGGMFRVGTGEDLMLSDKGTDVALSDMCLIYVGPRTIKRYLKEMARVARRKVVLCEFHHESFFRRLWLRLSSGYYAYNYRRLLEECGFYDIMVLKLREEDWPGGNPQKTFGCIMVATPPKR